jgi:hypothetical protein
MTIEGRKDYVKGKAKLPVCELNMANKFGYYAVPYNITLKKHTNHSSAYFIGSAHEFRKIDKLLYDNNLKKGDC